MSKKPPAPSAGQLEALKKMAAHGGRLERRSGGFWTWPGCPVRVISLSTDPVPKWSIATGTMRAMERRGWIARTNTDPVDLWDPREITPAGREVLAPQVAIEISPADSYTGPPVPSCNNCPPYGCRPGCKAAEALAKALNNSSEKYLTRPARDVMY